MNVINNEIQGSKGFLRHYPDVIALLKREIRGKEIKSKTLKKKKKKDPHLLEEGPHLSIFGLEPLELLMDPLVSLQLHQRGPLTVHVGAERNTEGTLVNK